MLPWKERVGAGGQLFESPENGGCRAVCQGSNGNFAAAMAADSQGNSPRFRLDRGVRRGYSLESEEASEPGPRDDGKVAHYAGANTYFSNFFESN